MSDNPRIDAAALKRDILKSTAQGSGMSRRALSLAATDGKNPDLVRDIVVRGRFKQLTVETVAGLASAMKKPLSDYVSDVPPPTGRERIAVIGAVQAGVWNERPEFMEEDRYEVEVEPSVLGGERFALEMVGHSMDRTIPPGSILECVRVFGPGGPEPRSGDIVIARRRRNDLTETTCKRLEITDGQHILRAESYKAEFAEPIVINADGDGEHSDNEIEIVAIVERATRTFATPR